MDVLTNALCFIFVLCDLVFLYGVSGLIFSLIKKNTDDKKLNYYTKVVMWSLIMICIVFGAIVYVYETQIF